MQPAAGLTLSDRRRLIWYAIERIEAYEKARIETEENPSAGSLEIQRAREHVRAAEAEFGWQWKNVKALLVAEHPRK
jgi:hypothetical protein